MLTKQMLTFNTRGASSFINLHIHEHLAAETITFVSFLPSVRHRLWKTGDVRQAGETG